MLRHQHQQRGVVGAHRDLEGNDARHAKSVERDSERRPEHTLHLVSGECIGSFLTTPEGKTTGSGSCSRRDKDGDVLNEEWVATDGAGAKGTSKLVGGTGKFARAAGSLQWEFTPLQGKSSAVRWTGNCQ